MRETPSQRRKEMKILSLTTGNVEDKKEVITWGGQKQHLGLTKWGELILNGSLLEK
jgi:hypothetical protein